MINYYEALEVDKNAKREQIRDAFRRLAKKFHPDLNPHASDYMIKKFHQVVDAYKVLSNPAKKIIYDQKLSVIQRNRQEPEKKTHDTREIVNRVFTAFLNGEKRKAMEMWEGLQARHRNVNLNRYFSEEDMMDFEFLLGEAYEEKGNLRKAVEIYDKLLNKEKEMNYFNSFADEIRERLKDVYLKKLCKRKSVHERIELYKKAVELGLNKLETSRICARIAQEYGKAKNPEMEKLYMERAFALGMKRNRKKYAGGERGD